MRWHQGQILQSMLAAEPQLDFVTFQNAALRVLWS
jgi:hypothetical protein